VGALEMPSNGDVLVMVLLTALTSKKPESIPEIGFFSAPVDREISVRSGRSASIPITYGRSRTVRRQFPSTN
jgi:hypothetical protein